MSEDIERDPLLCLWALLYTVQKYTETILLRVPYMEERGFLTVPDIFYLKETSYHADKLRIVGKKKN